MWSVITNITAARFFLVIEFTLEDIAKKNNTNGCDRQTLIL